MKQVIVMRTDLKMGKGKIAAQACHACLGCYKKSDKENIRKWEFTGQKKVVLKISSEEELLKLHTLVKETNLTCCLITDAGHTQIEPSTRTCLGIGPGPDDEIDKLTGHLKLL
ncbi:peptidyl-tRNA hydrolase Pth2 [Methanosphaera sp. WGK6]|uniref:peptidyl-tRNA hydrolase Pth2 n=1 Tax=Methanosphaera sp. WGK6 TaxID=1561964 RepID=UPI00084C868A|nr:peptidyl-tRNA hydrolase Pth2 [Methanosphaera sp. WGK6]OED30451.1 peptidyl-tRNA hydrolase [Methanosphaera sp. WGK6]